MGDKDGIDDADGLSYWHRHPNPTDEDLTAVCRTWIRYQRRYADEMDPQAGDPDWWAVGALCSLGYPPWIELEWRVIRMLCELVDPEDSDTVEMIGVGPIEDFLCDQGDSAMDLIEPVAQRGGVLLDALSAVWAFEAPVRPRVETFLASVGRTPAGGFEGER